MHLTPYHIQWSGALIQLVELRLRQLHACLKEFYQQHNYHLPLHHSATGDNDGQSQESDGFIRVVGSFLLRTCVHSTPFREAQLQNGVGADLSLTIPEEVCSYKDIEGGLYLARRHEFLLKVEKFVKKYNRQQINSGSGEAIDTLKQTGALSMDGATRSKGSRHDSVEWDVRRVPFGDYWGNAEKFILRVIFLKARSTKRREMFHIDIHFQPAALTGRIASATAIRKRPLYSHLVLEDAFMTSYLRKFHDLFSRSHSLQRAAVFLNCWAHHAGLMARTSGHPEGMSGFHILAIIMHLVKEGVVLPNMSDENVVRSVWVFLSRCATAAEASTNNRAGHNSKDESILNNEDAVDGNRKRQVMELYLAGESINLFFRISTEFFQNVIKSAVDEAIRQQRVSEALENIPFMPLQIRMDVCLIVSGLSTYFPEVDHATIAKGNSGAYATLEGRIHQLHAMVREALGVRASFVTVWRHDHDQVRIAVQLASEAEGRSRLTRGPAIECVDAVARFNEFWGSEMASTRQFPDGGIYRCVLWKFDEDYGTNTTLPLPATTVLRHVLQFALERHASPSVRVSVLLGGLEGVLAEHIGAEWRDAAPIMQNSLAQACRDVESMVAGISRTSLPCKITALDIISTSERCTAVFPIRPHLALTHSSDDLTQPWFSGLSIAATIEPVHGVLTIDDRNKIPDTVEAIATMKGAICAQLAKVLRNQYSCVNEDDSKNDGKGERGEREKLKPPGKKNVSGAEEDISSGDFKIVTSCTNHSVDIIYKGYLFRLYVAHYREVSLLRALQREAEAAVIEQKLFWSTRHAKFLRSVAFGHLSYTVATRLASRWISSMMLYEFVLPEAVELLVANAYLGPNPPKTPAVGFLRFLQLLVTHDWSSPLVLPYSVESTAQENAARLVRRAGENQGMFICTPYAPLESPFTVQTPRPMIMHRVVQLAKAALVLLLEVMRGKNSNSSTEGSIFIVNPAAFDFKMALHPSLLLQPDRLVTPPCRDSVHVPRGSYNDESGGGSMTLTLQDIHSSSTTLPPPPHIWRLDELGEEKRRIYLTELIEREPAAHIVRTVRAATKDRCMVFYDYLAPHSISVISITTSPTRELCQQLHDDILRISGGALMPATLKQGANRGLGERRGQEAQTKARTEKMGTFSLMGSASGTDAVAASVAALSGRRGVHKRQAGSESGCKGRRKRLRDERVEIKRKVVSSIERASKRPNNRRSSAPDGH
ncbi:hypothetical protein TRVL_01908 [Trypanosoma vivax]|nr:hypothetical protein TRVL_01908 [Trypanosoma vivax]